MKEPKVIVAVNKNGKTPIFQVANYGPVADPYQALPNSTRDGQEAP